MLNIEIHYTKQAASHEPEEKKEMVSCSIEFTINNENEFEQAIEAIKSAKEHYRKLVDLS